MRAPWRGLLFSLFFFFFATGERTRTTHHPTRAPFFIVLQPAAIFLARGDHRGRWACVLLDVLSATAKSTRDAAEDGGSLSFFGVVGGGKHTYSDKALLYTFRPQNKGQGTVWWLPAVEARACSARAHTHTNKQRTRASAVTCVGTHCALAAVLPPFFTTGPPPNETATKPESAYFCETQTPREGKTVSGKKVMLSRASSHAPLHAPPRRNSQVLRKWQVLQCCTLCLFVSSPAAAAAATIESDWLK